jgi:cytochrome c peroxidase
MNDRKSLKGTGYGFSRILPLLAALALSGGAQAQQQEPAPGIPGSLKNVPIPEPSDLMTYIKDRAAAIRLGKALFWDMQLGSDNQACASCHFHAGADDRTQASLDPGLRAVPSDPTYQLGGPNFTLQPSHFPLHRLSDPTNRFSTVLADTNDIVSSQGTYYTQFKKITLGSPLEVFTALLDPSFQVGGVPVRRVEPRNTPSVINAVFNVHNFWDGRASYWFNGNNPFGPLDMNSGVIVTTGTSGNDLKVQQVRIEKSALASQAVGPALSNMEMSSTGRTWPDVGKKMLSLPPLGLQIVHPNDSVLGSLSNAVLKKGVLTGTGLKTDYISMVKAAFQNTYWGSTKIVTFVNGAPVFSSAPNGSLSLDQYTQMEANFAFIFGLAVQMYESTLVSNDSPFDRYAENPFANPLTDSQQRGMGLYMAKGHCANCHTGAEFTNASLSFRNDPANRVELMVVNGGSAFYDGGWYNTGSRLETDDVGRVDNSPFTNPLTGQPLPLSYSKLGLLERNGLLPAALLPYVAPLPLGAGFPDPNRTAVTGAFKVPSLRNVELTGPYFHNGGQATLRQVVDFYDRGGDFSDANIADLHPDILILFMTDQEKDDLVSFLLALTDDRVRYEKAPFDHPQLFIPNGSKESNGVIQGNFDKILASGFRDTEQVRALPPVGALGLPAEGLPPIGTFLGLDPRKVDTTVP